MAMSTHINAGREEIAGTVLLPGDPLRAKYIAEHFLSHAKLYNKVRNALGYTGEYKGKRISVQGTGMGIPSISIYATELIREYGARTLLRVGTCGGMSKETKIRDVILAQAASTDSSIIHNTFGGGIYYAPIADFGLLETAYHIAKENKIPVKVGNVLSEDRFYNDEINRGKLADYGVLAVEMEAVAIYTLAAKYHCRALAILTVSDHLISGEATSADERETSFNDMIKVALDTALK
jgi:purine-nucleoside phosphorylase